MFLGAWIIILLTINKLLLLSVIHYKDFETYVISQNHW